MAFKKVLSFSFENGNQKVTVKMKKPISFGMYLYFCNKAGNGKADNYRKNYKIISTT